MGSAAGFHEDKVDVVIAPTALHLGHVKAPLEGLGMQVRWTDGHVNSSQFWGKTDSTTGT